MTITIDDRTEWLEPDGLGGFASGTTSGVRTRRYHALLLTATTPPTGRVVLVNGFEAWIDTAAGTFALTTQRYTPDILYPDGASRIVSFSGEPWPTWVLALPDGTRIIEEVFVQHDVGITVLSWTAENLHDTARLRVRPLLSGRDYHATHHENGAFCFEAEQTGATVVLRPYADIPSVICQSSGAYVQAPEWYRQFLYSAERERGLDDTEDLASPGEFSWRLTGDSPRAVMLLKPGGTDAAAARSALEVLELADAARDAERARRMGFRARLDRSADAYLVRRGSGRTVVAGYPWFTDWGRDTFISLRGLCVATGRLVDALDILTQWASVVSDGMLPNRFPDGGDALEFNSVDASLWYVIAVHEVIAAASTSGILSPDQRATLDRAVLLIIAGYARGTRFGIRMDTDGLLAAGVTGLQLTWMDARVGSQVITPRIGKPVEIQALWLNALKIAYRLDSSWRVWLDKGQESFIDRFWDDERGYLADVVDVDHVPNTRDDTFRPNQILALGGLPMSLIRGRRARRIVDEVERRLVTPLGLRSLAPEEPGYGRRYEGDPSARDALYHQGTVWPWLFGPFVDAWVRVRTDRAAARRDARQRFVTPLIVHLETAGLGHVSEIADAEPPFTPRGCPFQAWSLGELIRIDRMVLAEPRSRTP